MILNLIRSPSTGGCTFGKLDIDGQHECITLERPDVQIPAGKYPIEMTWSPRFSKDLPLLDLVTGRTDIRIHAGNWPRDTEGCILVGQIQGDHMILSSRLALEAIVQKIEAALKSGETIQISIS